MIVYDDRRIYSNGDIYVLVDGKYIEVASEDDYFEEVDMPIMVNNQD